MAKDFLIRKEDLNLRFIKSPDELLGKVFECISVFPKYDYVAGKKTDTIVGYNYEIECIEKRHASLMVFIPGIKQIEHPKEPIPVKFEGLKIEPYPVAQNNFIVWKIKATSLSLKIDFLKGGVEHA